MVNNPAEWSIKLQHAVLSTMQATFSPQLALKVALLLKRTKAKDPEILGMVRVGVNPNRSGTLLDLIVAEKHRRQGYGSLLFKGVFEQFQNVGCVEVNISVADGNEVGTAFLRKMGLRPYSVFWGTDVPPLEVRTVARGEVGGYHPK
jgi:ribosomal protein S18 acetylase RimI-like enzyme